MENQLNNLPHKIWLKNPKVRVILVAVLAVAILLIVVFNQQIGDLLELFGSKAQLEDQTMELRGMDFLDGHTSTPEGSFKLDPSTQRLMLNPPAQN